MLLKSKSFHHEDTENTKKQQKENNNPNHYEPKPTKKLQQPIMDLHSDVLMT